MKKTLSLKSRKEFQNVLKRGKWYGGTLICLYLCSKPEDKNYLGLGIGKKVGKAYQRNRVKRVIRAAYQEIEPYLKTGYQVVVVWRSHAKWEDLTFSRIRQDMVHAFRKAGVWKEDE